MKIVHWKDVEDVKMESFPYRGVKRPIIGTSIRWLSQHGDDGTGFPEYGLRLFTIQPGGHIPIHQHFYHQTMFIVSGRFECWRFDPDTEEIIFRQEVGPGSSIYIPSMEPHGMKNISDEAGTFTCCICNVYDEEKTI